MPIGPNQTTGSLIGRISKIKRYTRLKNAFLLDIQMTLRYDKMQPGKIDLNKFY